MMAVVVINYTSLPFSVRRDQKMKVWSHRGTVWWKRLVGCCISPRWWPHLRKLMHGYGYR